MATLTDNMLWHTVFPQMSAALDNSTKYSVVRAKDGKLRFPVWKTFQLHGDLGTRLGLKRKHSKRADSKLSMDSRHEKRWVCFRVEGPDENAANALTAYPITRSAAK